MKLSKVCAAFALGLALLVSGCSSDVSQEDIPSSSSVAIASEDATFSAGTRMLATESVVDEADLIEWSQARTRAAFRFRIPGNEEVLRDAQSPRVLPFDTAAGEGFTAYYGDDLIFTIEPQTGPLNMDGILAETYRPDLAKDDQVPAYVEVRVGDWIGYGHDLTTQTMRDGSSRNAGSMLSWTEKTDNTYVNYWMFSEHLPLEQLKSIAERLE